MIGVLNSGYALVIKLWKNYIKYNFKSEILNNNDTE